MDVLGFGERGEGAERRVRVRAEQDDEIMRQPGYYAPIAPSTQPLFLAPQSRAIHGPSPRPRGEGLRF
jgi:hypothetical protein